jgi:tRNA G10  N-methylase Trm11
MVGSTKYLFSCSKAHPTLAKRELERYYSSKAQEIAPGKYLFSLTTPPTSLQHFGFAHTVSTVLAQLPANEYISFAKHIKSPYKIELFQTTTHFTDTVQFADLLHPHVREPEVNLTQAKYTYQFFFLADTVFIGELLLENTDKPQERKAHRKKHLHPTSLDPALAKVMIAMSAKETFHDPFCGVGGIVIEGLLQEKKASGSDLVQSLVGKAKENALSFNLAPAFFVADATTLIQKTPAFISDLPYGKNSLLLESKDTLYKKFFQHAKQSTKLMVLGSDNSLQAIAEETGWLLEEEHTVYAHKSLTRYIGVFSLK